LRTTVIISAIAVIAVIANTVMLHAENIIANLEIGGIRMEEQTIEQDGNLYMLAEPIKFGRCKTNILNDIGTISIQGGKEMAVIVTPGEKCLMKKDVNFREVKPFVPRQNADPVDSGFVNYAVSVPDLTKTDQQVFSGGIGVFALNSLFYSDFTHDNTQAGNGFARGNAYIKKDVDRYLSQITVGNTYTQTQSPFPKSYPVVGVTVARKYSINPTVNPFNSLNQRLTLYTKSRVEIYRNEQLVLTREMDPDVHDLQNLPISAFSGDLTIRTVDAYGHEQIINVPYTMSTELLKKGMDDYNITVGQERIQGDTYSGFRGSTYYKRGITDTVTAGVSATDQSTAANITYNSKIGVFSAEKEMSKIHDNYSAGYYWSNNNYSFVGTYLKKSTSDFKVQSTAKLSAWGLPEKAGALTGLLYANGDTKIGLMHTFSPFTRLSVISEVSHSREQQMAYSVNTVIPVSQRATMGLGYSHTQDKGDAVYLSVNIPLGRDYGGLGFSGKAAMTGKDGGTYTDTETRGKYYMIASERSTYSKTTDWQHSASLYGSVACASGEGGARCGIGEPISPGQGFVVGPNTEANMTKGGPLGGIQVIPYQQQAVNYGSEMTGTNEDVSLREGQGLALLTTAKRAIEGRLTLNGRPYKNRLYTHNGKEFSTDEDGYFNLEKVKGNKIELMMEDKKVSILIPESADEIAIVGTIEIQPKQI